MLDIRLAVFAELQKWWMCIERVCICMVAAIAAIGGTATTYRIARTNCGQTPAHNILVLFLFPYNQIKYLVILLLLLIHLFLLLVAAHEYTSVRT